MNKYFTLIFTLVTALSLAGCSKADAPASQPPTPPTAAVTAEWRSDGAISPGEYANMQKIGEIEVFTRVEGDSAMFALRAKTAGWIAIGIDPAEKMRDADIWMCSFQEGKPVVVDQYSTGTYGPHPPDEAQGGKQDIEMVSGTYQDGVSVFEFKRKLDTGDGKDKVLKIGNNKVMWSIGETAATTVKHAQRGYGTLVLNR